MASRIYRQHSRGWVGLLMQWGSVCVLGVCVRARACVHVLCRAMVQLAAVHIE